MKIVEVGRFFKTTAKIEYYSHSTILEYDALLIDFDYLLKSTGKASSETKQMFLKRRSDLMDFISFKEIPIIYFVPQPRKIQLYISLGKYELPTFDFFAPIPNISVFKEFGTAIQIVQKTIFTEFLEKYKHCFRYNSYFAPGFGTTIIETPLTKKVLGFFTNEYIFLPQPEGQVLEQEGEFLTDLMTVAKLAFDLTQVSELPEWANNYYLPKEQSLINEIKQIGIDISTLNAKLNEREKNVNELSFIKRIFTGSGNELDE